MPTNEQVIEQLRKVQDPELRRNLVTLNMVKDVVVSKGKVHVHVELTTPACPLKDRIAQDVRAAGGARGGRASDRGVQRPGARNQPRGG